VLPFAPAKRAHAGSPNASFILLCPFVPCHSSPPLPSNVFDSCSLCGKDNAQLNIDFCTACTACMHPQSLPSAVFVESPEGDNLGVITTKAQLDTLLHSLNRRGPREMMLHAVSGPLVCTRVCSKASGSALTSLQLRCVAEPHHAAHILPTAAWLLFGELQ
jgi:hypothetical protein